MGGFSVENSINGYYHPGLSPRLANFCKDYVALLQLYKAHHPGYAYPITISFTDPDETLYDLIICEDNKVVGSTDDISKCTLYIQEELNDN